ncbi:hypothetical protein SARC_03369 [Sphaeroforma arctica JP610]|uniref:Uncharacterized protein n=1 Tax=Sphaeroforma arctica JP610 TaxID=667725 RepID=A0A0L0G5V0_9EUKA|nr:hypothetical protein SARC_03369 [Sphaeroforma arctica JP610]KNC84407.1 hypothetical protein SARC_03369 [Sphaeroforma arctica JP610]|eukprot:XP_014158309.1 hypothetical protein SARC_03369 [Sphaeroforma arctica JP610]
MIRLGTLRVKGLALEFNFDETEFEHTLLRELTIEGTERKDHINFLNNVESMFPSLRVLRVPADVGCFLLDEDYETYETDFELQVPLFEKHKVREGQALGFYWPLPKPWYDDNRIVDR